MDGQNIFKTKHFFNRLLIFLKSRLENKLFFILYFPFLISSENPNILVLSHWNNYYRDTRNLTSKMNDYVEVKNIV